ncbi:MAG: hypothetical protein K8T89_07495 [Planctomycetes bacterium]|nr:hypothetical protein [Planctomycetota bacterium]
MFKKLFTIAIIAVVGTYLVGETKAGSHVKAWFGRMSAKLDKKIDSETELARIKHEVGQLDGDVDKVKGDLAEANVNVRLLRRDVDDLRTEMKANETAVRKHGDVVKAAAEGDKIQWGYRTVSYVDAKELLLNEVKRHNDLKARLKAREQALVIQEQTRDLVEQQLQEMLKQKDELASAVSEMEAEIKLAKVEQIRSKYQNDGTRMSDIKTSLGDLRKKVMIQREKLRMSETYTKNPATAKSVDEILGGLDGHVVDAKGNDEVRVIKSEK